MELRATHRLRAMRILKGDNLPNGPRLAKNYLNTSDIRGLKELMRHDDQVLVKSPSWSGDQYTLIEVGPKFVFNPRKKLTEMGARAALAFILVKEGRVHQAWTSPDVRGQGYGKALYRATHMFSARGIESSFSMGTLSLGTWLSLYKSEPAIVLIIDGRRQLKRSEVRIEGLKIYVPDYPELTSEDGPDFNFWWPK